MSARASSLLGLLLVVALPAAAVACLWDYDTLKMERSRFPSVLELVTGKFLRHSTEFYQWRIKDRTQRIAASPEQADLYDDLAVAYQKTCQTAKAIETMESKEKIQPGLYETYSNLGTFYILDGDFERGLPYIDRALAINPDAHFGREKYQKWLVEYAMTKRRDGKLVFPLSDGEEPGKYRVRGFHRYLQKALGMQELSGDAAVQGVLGMMRFANHENPLLLEALGDLLGSSSGGQLAARAYLKAGMVVPEAKDAFRALATKALGTKGDSLAAIEAEFAIELADAEAWYAELKVENSAGLNRA